MNRRQILITTGAIISATGAGCLGAGDGGTDETDTSTSLSPSEPPDDCGPAALPLSELLTDETGDPAPCFEGATPSLAIENERDETLPVAVRIEDGELAETYSLESGERVVEASAFEARSEVSGTVTIDGEERHRLLWPERSCYRHGIALGSEAIETGWIEPLEGLGDTQHDCYAGVDATKPFDEMADS